MKIFVIGFACLALTSAQHAPSSIYLPQVQDISYSVDIPGLSNEYLAPVADEPAGLADDGYRYRTVRRLRLRHKRDVSELSQYLPPTQEDAVVESAAPINDYLAPAAEETTVLADDGYRYKTVRRHRQRRRRDVSELAQYLPPAQEEAVIEITAPTNEYLASAAEEETILADDGYHYKTIRRLRHKREVAELSQYLPPGQEEAVIEISTPTNEYLSPDTEEQTVLADDGYRYKTVRSHRQRIRRDVSELAQYLPPAQEEPVIEISEPTNEYLAPAAEEQTVLADDGYRYRTVHRHRQRRRRDVSELSQYLPPAQETISYERPDILMEYFPPSFDQQQTDFGNDGYRYKTVKRLRVHRH